MARKAHHKIEPHCTMELRVLIENPQPFMSYKTHPCPHMVQQVTVAVTGTRSILDMLLRRPARPKFVVLERPSTKIAIGHATVYCHPDHIIAIENALSTQLINMVAAATAKQNRKLEAVCQ